MPLSLSALQTTHAAVRDKVLTQQGVLLSSSSPSSSSYSSKSTATATAPASPPFPLDNISEGTWTLFSPGLLALQSPRFFAEYDPECDEWVLELYDTDFANELYPGSFAPGELLVRLHVGERHVSFAPVPRPEYAVVEASDDDDKGQGAAGVIQLVQSFKVDGRGGTSEQEEEEEKDPDGVKKNRVTARLRFLGAGCLVLEVPARDLVDGRGGGVGGGGGGAAADEMVTLYGTFEEDGEDEFEYIAAGEGDDRDFA